MAGDYDEGALKQAGFSDQEIEADKAKVGQQLSAAGYSDQDVAKYFGAPPEPDMKSMKNYVTSNLQAYKTAQSIAKQPTASVDGAPKGEVPADAPHPAESLLDAIQAGYQMSVTGLISRNKLPDQVLPENAEFAMRMASQAGTLVGDLPAMVAGGVFGGSAGGFLGGVAGSEVPGVGNVVGAAVGAELGKSAGAFGLPAGIRSFYIQKLQKGEIHDASDFAERAGAVLLDTVKGMGIGAATAGAGLAAGGLLAKSALSGTSQAIAKQASELAVMTSVGKAMEGQLPKASDFAETAIMMIGMHGATEFSTKIGPVAKNMQEKLQNIYAKTGIKPIDVATAGETDPVLKQELLSMGSDVPKSLEHLVDPPHPGQEMLEPPKPVMMDAKVPPALGEKLPTFGEGFTEEPSVKVHAPEEPPEAKEAEPTEPHEPGSSEAAVASMLSRIGESTETKDRGWDNTYTKTIDKLNPIEKLTEAMTGNADLHPSEDPYALLSMAKGKAYARAEAAINRAPLDFETGQITGKPSLKTIVTQFGKEEIQNFKAYAIARHSLALEERGIETGTDLAEAKRVVADHGSKFEQGFQELVDFQNSTLKYLRDAQVISADLFNKVISTDKTHIPMFRIQEDGTAGGGNASGANAVKRQFGSDKKIVDPFESIIKNQYQLYRIAEENRGKLSIVKLAEANEVDPSLIEKNKITQRPVTISANEILDGLKKQGMDTDHLDPDAIQVFREVSQPVGKNEFAVMRNGEREVWTVDPSVAKALRATDYEDPHMVLKVVQGFAKVQRYGVTENPMFLAKHFGRAEAVAFLQSKNGYRPVIDGLRGLAHYFKDSDQYHEFLNQGGGMSTLMDFDKKYVKPDVWGLSKETGLIDKMRNVVKSPFELLDHLSQGVFVAPKLGEYLRATEKGKDPQTAAYEARRLGGDMQQVGSDAFIRGWSAATPFMSMRMRGLDSFVEAFTENKVGVASRLAIGVALPSLLTWWFFKDDERYRDAPDYEKDLSWIIPIGPKESGYAIRVPKPFEQGLLAGSLIERTMSEFYDHNPDAFKGFGEALIAATIPNVTPSIVAPMLEQKANRSFMTGGNIVPHTLEGVAPAYQYTPYTSETAKRLSKVIGAIPGVSEIGHKNITLSSPMIVQNYVHGWMGEAGMIGLKILDKSLEVAGVTPPIPKPATTLADNVFVRSFITRFPKGNTQPIIDFYDNLEKTQTHAATISHLKKSGDGEELGTYFNSREGQMSMGKLTNQAETISKMNRGIQLITVDPSMTPNDKRQQIDDLYYGINMIARQGNQLMELMHKNANSRQ